MNTVLAVPPEEVHRLAFLGTPDVSVVALRALVGAGFDVAPVVTRQDRRRGRGSKLAPSPVKEAALELGLPVTHELADVAGCDVDLGVVVAYGRIIPVSLLEDLAMVNLHFSLLPRWRGAAPVERAILAGDTGTGVCLMEVAEGLDEGGVYARAELEIDGDATATGLRSGLAVIGADLLITSLRNGLATPEPQVGEITYAAKIDKAELRLDFAGTALQNHRTVRVGRAWTEFRGRRIGIERTRVLDGSGHPGLLDGSREGCTVATPNGLLELIAVRPEGKRSMAASDWVNGVQPEPGERLG